MRQFRVLRDYRLRQRYPDCPQFVNWDIVADHRRQAERNHGQSLETLNSRGGLSPDELYAILNDRPYKAIDLRMAIDYIKEYGI
jgi:hypothetical protein